MRIGLINESSLVSDADADAMATVVDAQLNRDVLPLWGRLPIEVRRFAKGEPLPADVVAIHLVDDPGKDDAGDLGWHDEDATSGALVGRVFARPILDAGGGVLTPGTSGDSVSAVFSHEAIEAALDPSVDLWADGPISVGGKAWRSIAFEACDPVQAGAYVKGASGSEALVSNFVLPAYFDPKTFGSWDFLGQLRGPFSVAEGGYAIVRDAPGSESSEFASEDARPWRVGSRRFARLVRAARI